MKKMNFARNFTALRKQKNMTQEGIAEQCGVSRQAVTKWETGMTVPDVYKLIDISEIFGVNLDELICGTFDPGIGLYTRKELMDTFKELVYDTMKKVINENQPKELVADYANNSCDEINDGIPMEAFYYEGLEEAENGNWKEAISLLEEALTRGELNAVEALFAVYTEIIDECACKDDRDEFYQYKFEFAQKMQVYGKIIEMEFDRMYH